MTKSLPENLLCKFSQLDSAAIGGRAQFDERVAPPTNEKSNPGGLLRSLRRVDRKDAILFCVLYLIFHQFHSVTFCIIQNIDKHICSAFTRQFVEFFRVLVVDNIVVAGLNVAEIRGDTNHIIGNIGYPLYII